MTIAADDDLVLLTPGPAGTAQRVKNAMLRGDLCHREPEFARLLDKIRTGLARAANLADTHETVLITGSGTAAMEAAVINSVREDRALLVLDNGVYGERLLKIAQAHRIQTFHIRFDGDALARWTTPIDPQTVENILASHPEIDAVACVHHETTTGLINPIREIGWVAAEHGVLFVVDAISSLGGEEQDLSEVQADVICGSSNKALHGQPGLAFLLCSAQGVARLAEVPMRSLYLHAATYLDAQRRGEVPFTPAIQVCYALDEALDAYFEAGGFAARRQLYRDRSQQVRQGYERLGLDILVAPEDRSNSVTMLHLPEGVEYPVLHDAIKHCGYVMYAGQGHLASDFFRLCTLGEIPAHRLDALEAALGQAIAAARRHDTPALAGAHERES